jgi:hypothetical protein
MSGTSILGPIKVNNVAPGADGNIVLENVGINYHKIITVRQDGTGDFNNINDALTFARGISIGGDGFITVTIGDGIWYEDSQLNFFHENGDRFAVEAENLYNRNILSINTTRNTSSVAPSGCNYYEYFVVLDSTANIIPGDYIGIFPAYLNNPNNIDDAKIIAGSHKIMSVNPGGKPTNTISFEVKFDNGFIPSNTISAGPVSGAVTIKKTILQATNTFMTNVYNRIWYYDTNKSSISNYSVNFPEDSNLISWKTNTNDCYFMLLSNVKKVSGFVIRGGCDITYWGTDANPSGVPGFGTNPANMWIESRGVGCRPYASSTNAFDASNKMILSDISIDNWRNGGLIQTNGIEAYNLTACNCGSGFSLNTAYSTIRNFNGVNNNYYAFSVAAGFCSMSNPYIIGNAFLPGNPRQVNWIYGGITTTGSIGMSSPVLMGNNISLSPVCNGTIICNTSYFDKFSYQSGWVDEFAVLQLRQCDNNVYISNLTGGVNSMAFYGNSNGMMNITSYAAAVAAGRISVAAFSNMPVILQNATSATIAANISMNGTIISY